MFIADRSDEKNSKLRRNGISSLRHMSPLQGWDAGWISSYKHFAPTTLRCSTCTDTKIA